MSKDALRDAKNYFLLNTNAYKNAKEGSQEAKAIARMKATMSKDELAKYERILDKYHKTQAQRQEIGTKGLKEANRTSAAPAAQPAPAATVSGAASGAPASKPVVPATTTTQPVGPAAPSPVVPAATTPIQQMAHGGHTLSNGLVYLHSDEMVIPAEVERLKPASMTTLYDRMTQRFASGGAEKSGNLSKVEEYNRLQLEQLITLHNDLRELITSVRPASTSGGRVANEVSPTSYPEPPGSTGYGLWPMGQSISNAQRQAQYPVG
jgi:hypothetical protein